MTKGSYNDEPKCKEWGIDFICLVEELENNTTKCLIIEEGDDWAPLLYHTYSIGSCES